jgi:hypothetical protein
VIINVQNGLTVAAGSSIADPSVPASAIRWNLVSGNVSVGGNGAALGVFYAPNSDLDIGGTGDFSGAISARNVTVSGNGGIHIDEDAVSGVTFNQPISTTTISTVGYTATSYSLWRITQALN